MTSKHTPGPWWIGIETDKGEVEVVSDDRPYICMVLPGAIDGLTLANARLIAAAPELLEALTNVLDALGALTKRHELLNFMDEEDAEQVWTAIAKATGAQP